MKISIVVSTYNKPDYLRLSLESLLRQTRLPDEIIVADDGSTDETRRLIEEIASKTDVPIVHVWHEDKGFRLAEIRNKAIARASGDYIIQIDGDIVAERHFVADHATMAEEGYFIRGTRTRLDPGQTAKTIKIGRIPLSVDLGLALTQPFNRLRLPMKMAAIRSESNGSRVKGCNMSFWKTDLLKVNGYDNRMQGWGHEDEELAWRLVNAGLKKKVVKFKAVAYHLYHPELPQDNEPNQRKAANDAEQSGNYRTPDGILSL